MQSIQLVAPRTLEPRAMPMPADPGPGEILVRVREVGICGSDMHWYLEGSIGWSEGAYPQVLGHEPAGEVAAVGEGVTGFAAGDRVSLEPSIACGHCEFCLSGRHNNCDSSVFMGSPQMPGFFREYALAPARNAVHVPPGMSFTQAALIEPLAVLMHVLELAPIRLGETVAVMGAGPIGLISTAVARSAGASKVFTADRIPHRLALAREMGATCVVNTQSESIVDAILDSTRGRGVDLVIDAAGALETVNAGIRATRSGGRLVLIGIPSVKDFSIDIHSAMAKELSLQTIKRSNHTSHQALALMNSGAGYEHWERIVTHRFPLEQTPAAFETLAAYADGIGKAIIRIP